MPVWSRWFFGKATARRASRSSPTFLAQRASISLNHIFRAKEILKDIVRLRGNVPPSVLIAGTTDDVREYCRKLIDVVDRGGGFILEGATSVPNEARPENVFAMYEMAKTYGRY